jgi:hypothetical protein
MNRTNPTDLKAALEAWMQAETNKIHPPLHPAWEGERNDCFHDGAWHMLDLLWPVIEAADAMQEGDEFEVRRIYTALAELKERVCGKG